MLQDLAYTIVYANDVDRCIAFYRDVLGMPVEYSQDGWTQFKTNGAALVVHPQVETAPSGGAVHLTFRVDDVESTYHELSDKSVKFLTAPTITSFGKHATMCDPEGNPIDLIEWASAKQPGLISDGTVVNDILVRWPEAMEVLEEHGIRICGGCIILLNGSVRETAEYSGLSPAEASEMVEELNDHVNGSQVGGAPAA